MTSVLRIILSQCIVALRKSVRFCENVAVWAWSTLLVNKFGCCVVSLKVVQGVQSRKSIGIDI